MEFFTNFIVSLSYNITSIELKILKYNLFTRHPNYYKKFFYIFLPSIRMSEKSINFEDKKNQQE